MKFWEKPGGSWSGCGRLSPLSSSLHWDKTWWGIIQPIARISLSWHSLKHRQFPSLSLSLKGSSTISRTGIWKCMWELSSPKSSHLLAGHSSSNINRSFSISRKVYNYSHSLESSQQRRTFLGWFRNTSADLHWERNAVWKNGQWFTDSVSY